MWVTPNNQDGPYIHISVSYPEHCQLQEPVQTLTDFGEITIGHSYHIKINTNDSYTTVTAHCSDTDRFGVYAFPRESPTDPNHIGRNATVYWMSGKFGTSSYNRGNGTFSNIVLISSGFNVEPTVEPTPQPTVEPSQPTSDPTSDPTSKPTSKPTQDPEEFTVESQSTASSATDLDLESEADIDSPSSDSTDYVVIDPVLLISLLIVCALLLITCFIAFHFAAKSKRNRERKRTETAGSVPSSRDDPMHVNGEFIYDDYADGDRLTVQQTISLPDIPDTDACRPMSTTLVMVRAQPEGGSNGVSGHSFSGDMGQSQNMQKMSFLAAKQRPPAVTVITDFNSSEMYRGDDLGKQSSQWSDNLSALGVPQQRSAWTVATSELYVNPESDEEVTNDDMVLMAATPYGTAGV